MSRHVQPLGKRGSLKWIQRAINDARPRALDELVIAQLDGAREITWRSPLLADDYAEYRDASFLEKVGASSLAAELRSFWPARGPQWDALGTTDANDILLVEAKAHVAELFSQTGAGPASREVIERALHETKAHVGAEPRAAWPSIFYQLANRLAHLHFLRRNSLQAWLVLVNFTGDSDVQGPQSEREWKSAYEVVWHVLGIPKRHPLSRYVIEVFPDVRSYEQQL